MKQIKIHQHHISEFLNCRMKFHLSQNLHITSRVSKKYLDLGEAFHLGTSTWKKTSNKELSIATAFQYFEDKIPVDQNEQDELDKAQVVVQAMLMGYFDKYNLHKSLLVERKLICKIGNITLVGTPDSIYKDNGYWLQEDKTASKLDEDYVTRLPLDFQITFYFYLAQKSLHKRFSGIDYRITKTPSIRLKKKQTKVQYLMELALEYSTYPEYYFVNEKLYCSQDDLKIFEKEIKQIVEDLMQCYKTGHWYRNEFMCKRVGCQFEKFCINPYDLEIFYKKREDLHRCFSSINKIKGGK